MPRRPHRPQPITEIKRVGREWHFQIRIGCTVQTVLVTAKEFNRMMDDLVESEDVSKSVLDKMASICRKNFRKGRVIKKLRNDTIQNLKDGYADYFECPWETICLKDRHAAYIEMRMLVYGSLNAMGYSYAEIAVFFIDRHRTAIMSSVERYNDLRKVERGFEFKAELLAKHMHRWMFGEDPNPPTKTQDSMYVSDPDPIHSSTDIAEINRQAGIAANKIGKALLEIWETESLNGGSVD